MAGTAGSDPERGRQSLKPRLSWDRGLQLALVNVESLVTARHHRAVNTSLLLAHTARRSPQGGRSRNKVAVGEPAAGSPPEEGGRVGRRVRGLWTRPGTDGLVSEPHVIMLSAVMQPMSRGLMGEGREEGV